MLSWMPSCSGNCNMIKITKKSHTNINIVLIIELLILIIAPQILPFLIYGIDKLFAKLGFFRIPEKALLATTFIFGIIGSIAAMMMCWFLWV